MELEAGVVIEKHILAEWTRGPFAGMRLSAAWYGAGSLMPPHAHVTASVSLVVGGVFAERIDGTSRRGPGLGVIVKPSGVVHETRCGASACRTVSLELPSRLESQLRSRLGLFARVGHEDDPDWTAALVELWRRVRGGGLEHDDAWMERWWAGCDGRSIEGGRQDRRQDRRQDWRHDRRLDAALAIGAKGGGAAEAADAAGVHPVHLCRLFHAATGRGTAANFRRARVRRAAEELSGCGSLAGVAAASGFADQAHMTRAFVRETGVTPGVLRALLVDRV